jgi:hypothetical protein
LDNNHFHETTWNLSNISSGPTTIPLKILSFRVRHSTQITACQTNITPFNVCFRFRKPVRKHWKREPIEPGTTVVIPNHRWTLDHTTQAVRHEANKWSSFSLPPPHKTQPTPASLQSIPLCNNFSLVGSRPRSACHENTITLDGAQLPHTLAITPVEFNPELEGGRNFLYKNEYKADTKNWSPNSNSQESLTFVIDTVAINSNNSVCNSSSQVKKFLL